MKRDVLIIGNSYSLDCHKYVNKIAASMGVELDVHLLQKSGGKIKEIYDNRNRAFFDYRINDIVQNGAVASAPINGGTGCYTISEILETKEFDTVVLQNYWGSSEGILHYKNSGNETDCSPAYEDLAEWVKEKQPHAKIMINAVWSNEIGYNYSDKIKAAAAEAGFTNEGGESDFFYDMLERYNSQAAVDVGRRINADASPIEQIPVGYAVQLARNYVDVNGLDRYRTEYINLAGVPDYSLCPSLPKDKEAGRLRLNRDGFHLSFAGRYLVGLVWVRMLTGLDIRKCTYVPEPETLRCGVQRITKTFDIVNINFERLSDENAAILRELAYLACMNFTKLPPRGLDGKALPFVY